MKAACCAGIVGAVGGSHLGTVFIVRHFALIRQLIK